jgi:uncharacterized membrane protein YcjF (UPF0283 family)
MNFWQLPAMLSALSAVIVAVVTAILGLWQVRRVTRERLDETIDEYAKVNNAKDIRIEELEKSAVRQEEKITRMSQRIGQIEGRNLYLMQDKMLLERYCTELRALMLRAGLPVPPRPQIEQMEENAT